jgi:hypothetical protein
MNAVPAASSVAIPRISYALFCDDIAFFMAADTPSAASALAFNSVNRCPADTSSTASFLAINSADHEPPQSAGGRS